MQLLKVVFNVKLDQITVEIWFTWKCQIISFGLDMVAFDIKNLSIHNLKLDWTQYEIIVNIQKNPQLWYPGTGENISPCIVLLILARIQFNVEGLLYEDDKMRIFSIFILWIQLNTKCDWRNSLHSAIIWI